MGIDPLTAGIVGGVLLGGTSVVQASQQNRAVQRAAEAEKATQDVAAAERRQITARELQALEGSIRASSAGRGVAGSASQGALSLATFESAKTQAASIELNRLYGNAATDARAAAQYSSPLLAGISGFSTGFSLGNSLGSFGSAAGAGAAGPPAGTGPNFLGAPGQGGFVDGTVF